jgi:hypothetical protein
LGYGHPNKDIYLTISGYIMSFGLGEWFFNEERVIDLKGLHFNFRTNKETTNILREDRSIGFFF